MKDSKRFVVQFTDSNGWALFVSTLEYYNPCAFGVTEVSEALLFDEEKAVLVAKHSCFNNTSKIYEIELAPKIKCLDERLNTKLTIHRLDAEIKEYEEALKKLSEQA